jgi:uncharacterized protein (DUF1330 family)
LEEYRRRAVPVLQKYGGRVLVRLGTAEVLEGHWPLHRLMVLEFQTMDALKRWWNSEDYQPLIPLRQRVSNAQVIAVDGV